IKCTHVYQCPASDSWKDEKEREKYHRDFEPGEFEEIHKSLHKIELIFNEYSNLDLKALLEVIKRLNQDIPLANVKLRRIERDVKTTATLTTATKELIEKVTCKLPEQYAKLETELGEIKKLIAEQKPQSLSPDWLTEAKEIASHSSGKLLTPPNTIIVMNQPRDFVLPTAPSSGPTDIDSTHNDNCQYFFSSPTKAEEIARQIIEQLRTSENVPKTLADLDTQLSPQLENSPKKEKWLKNALEKSKDLLVDISGPLATITTGAAGGMLANLLKSILL
ncbi:MAG: hypothetical protein ACXACY_27385, partial [Candidatus Hodarchaeales archaeon]